MLEKLRKLFGEENVITNPAKDQLNYYWYYDESAGTFGVNKSILTEDHLAMLQLFFKPLAFGPLELTETERQWSKLLFTDENATIDSIHTLESYRFIHFRLEKTIDQPYDFKEALETFFSEKPFILWKNKLEGVVVHHYYSQFEEIDFSSLVKTLVADFYINITLLIGRRFSLEDHVRELYLLESSFVPLIKPSLNKEVLFYFEVIPTALFQKATEGERKLLKEYVLQSTIEDKELLQTVMTFIKSNLNATLASKELYMHRNSLQYRIDKFIDRTGIDIKQFEQALVVYIAIFHL